MAEALILDSEALNALARPRERGVSLERARAILSIAVERNALVRVPAAVLAELYRGVHHDPAVDRLLNARGIAVVDLTRDIARQAGHILERSGMSSAHAIDAFVVATSLTFARAVIATSDPTDIARLAAPFSQVRVYAL